MPTPREAMPRTVGPIQRDPLVQAVWIAGSVRDGTDDEVSDLDLWVETSDWTPDRIPGLLVAGSLVEIGGGPLLHGVTPEGVIVDLRYGPAVPPEYRKLPEMEGETPTPWGMDLPGFRTDFWIGSYKHRKTLWRGLDAMALFGLHFERMALVKAWAEEANGGQEAEISFTIHGLTALVREHLTSERMDLLGLPTRNRAELLAAVQAFRSEMRRMSPPGSRLPEIVMADPLFARIVQETVSAT